MRTSEEISYLLKAVDAFKRSIHVVSADYCILATSRPVNSPEEMTLTGRKCYEVYHERPSPCPACAIPLVAETRRPALRARQQESYEIGQVPCHYCYPILASDNSIEAFAIMDFDLPTEGDLKQVLQRSNILLLNLIHSSVDGVIAADKKGRILIFNDAAAQITGYKEEEALYSLKIYTIYPEDGAYTVMRMLRSPEFGGKGKIRGYRAEVLHKNGTRIPISLNAAIVYEAGREVATIGYFHDLRDELRIQGELERAQLQLMQSEKMASLGKLAAGVAHQINNPLGGITLYAKLMLEEHVLTEAVRDDLQRILKDAERCRDTVKELLEFTRQTRHLMQPHDINRAIGRTLFLLRSQPLFHNIALVEELAESLPLVTVDIQQINHLIMNLLINAAQAMEGRGTLTIRSMAHSTQPRVAIEVADTGPGIAPEILPSIFEPFFTTKEEGKGTGLGLSLAYSIVETHGGTIKAFNRPEGGALFRIELPLSQQPKEAPEGGNR